MEHEYRLSSVPQKASSHCEHPFPGRNHYSDFCHCVHRFCLCLFHRNGIIQYVQVGVWLLLWNVTSVLVTYVSRERSHRWVPLCQSLYQISLKFAIIKTVFHHCFGINENFLGSYGVTTAYNLNFFKTAFQEIFWFPVLCGWGTSQTSKRP